MSKNTTDLIYAMLTNRNLARYIHYIGDFDPLDVNLPNVKSSVVKANNFVLTHFNLDVLSEAKILVFINPVQGKFNSNNVLAGDQYVVDIIIPYKYWYIGNTGELRAYKIAYEICQAIDFKNVAGIGNVEITNWNSSKVNDLYSGLKLFISVTNGTMNSGA